MPNYATSGTVLNYSGLLFNKGNTLTPFSTMIAGNRRVTNHVEFTTGQEYTTATGSQPEISETASLTAPEGTITTRTQNTNVTQIFQETVGVSYAKESNMGTLSGINVAGQMANPASELDFQVASTMAKIAQDVEYTFINGVYQKSTGDAVANKSCGLVNAITTNAIAAAGEKLTFMIICDAIKAIKDANGDTSNLVLGVDSTQLMQINADAIANDMTIVDASRTINGIAVQTVLTPLGRISIADMKYLPTGTALLFDPRYMAPVDQPVPGKGNFFMEDLAKVGAGTRKMIFGQLGLDYGPEWFSAKITGLSTAMPTAKDMAKRVYQVSE